MADQTHPCDFCGYPNPLNARTCEACGQPVRMPAQDATILVPRKPLEEPATMEEALAALEPAAEEPPVQPEPPAPLVEPAAQAYTPPTAPEPFPDRELPDYPMVTPKAPPKKSKTGLIIALILIGGLICLLAVAAGGYFLVRNLTNRFQPTLESLVSPQENILPDLEKNLLPTLESVATFIPIPLEPSKMPPVPLATPIQPEIQLTPEKPSVLTGPFEGQLKRDAIIVDDFESDILEWGSSSDDISVHQIEDGAYTILVEKPEYIAWTDVPVEWFPYYAEFDVWVPGGGDGGSFGILCHFQNDSDYYYVEMDISDLSYSIGRYLDGEYLPVTDPGWVSTDALNDGSAVNHVFAACELDKITLFINEQFVAQVALPEPAQAGEMAIFGSTWDDMPAGGYKVYFDNLTAWKPVE